jgi:hypothetical protein
MSRFNPSVPAVLVLCAWSVAALADDAPSAAAAVQAASASSAPAAAKSMQAKASTPASASDPSVQKLVCLNMSLQCFAMKPKPEDTPAKTQASTLDLKAPDIRRIVPEVELREPLVETTEIEEQQVQIEGQRPEVYVPGGIASLPWAVMHPTQAWRIFLPVPPGTAK